MLTIVDGSVLRSSGSARELHQRAFHAALSRVANAAHHLMLPGQTLPSLDVDPAFEPEASPDLQAGRLQYVENIFVAAALQPHRAMQHHQ